MNVTVTPLQLARMSERDLVLFTEKLRVEKRQVEQLLIGRLAMRAGDEHHQRLTISSIRLTPSGAVQVFGRKRRDSSKEHLLGGLGSVEILS